MKVIDLNINKLFDDVFIRKLELEYWEREQIINHIMFLRDLINAKTDVKEEEYYRAEDETIVFVINQLLEIYGIKFFSRKNYKNENNFP